jgi:hypothetical protein
VRQLLQPLDKKSRMVCEDSTYCSRWSMCSKSSALCAAARYRRTSILCTCCAPNQRLSVQVAQCVLQKALDPGEDKLQLALDVCDLVLQRVHILKLRARRISGVTSGTKARPTRVGGALPFSNSLEYHLECSLLPG